MDIFGIIEERKSCRTFNGLRLDKEVIVRLEQEILNLPQLFKDVALPEIRFVDAEVSDGRLGTYGFITGARQFLVMASGKTPAELVQAGYMFETLILRATAMGLGTCWVGGTFRKSQFAKAFGGNLYNKEIVIISPVGHPTPKRRFAERMIRKVTKENQRKPFGMLFPGVGENTPLGRVLQSVRWAPSSTNSQPWRATCKKNPEGKWTVDFSCSTNNRFSAIDMGIAYCHFLLTSGQENLAWKYESVDNPLGLVFKER